MRIKISPLTHEEAQPMTETEILQQYNRMFDALNRRYFNNELPAIEITYPDKHKEINIDALACFASDYERKESPIILLQFHSMPEHGISIDDIDNLFHELIHYHCYINYIDDTGYDGNYHTLLFKQEVEKHGGSCNYTDEINGYNETHLSKKELWKIFDEI